MMWQSGSPGQVVWLRRGSGDLGTADGKPIRLDSDAFQDESTRLFELALEGSCRRRQTEKLADWRF